MSVELTILISIVSIFITLFGAIVGYQTFLFKKNSSTKKETKVDVEESTQVKTGLDYISKGVDEIRIDLRANEKHMNALSERVTRVEESTKQAHKRIDYIDPNKNRSE